MDQNNIAIRVIVAITDAMREGVTPSIAYPLGRRIHLIEARGVTSIVAKKPSNRPKSETWMSIQVHSPFVDEESLVFGALPKIL